MVPSRGTPRQVFGRGLVMTMVIRRVRCVIAKTECRGYHVRFHGVILNGFETVVAPPLVRVLSRSNRFYPAACPRGRRAKQLAWLGNGSAVLA